MTAGTNRLGPSERLTKVFTEREEELSTLRASSSVLTDDLKVRQGA